MFLICAVFESAMLSADALMVAGFTSPELRQLLETALYEGEYELLRLAVKACGSAGVSASAILWQILDVPEKLRTYRLKKLFRGLARFNQLDALSRLAEHPSVEVRLAVVHAWYNFGVEADAPRLEKLLSDEDPRVRIRAHEAVAVIRNPVNRPRARDAVDDVLNEDERVVANAILVRLEHSDLARVARLLNASSAAIRQLARKALQAADPSGDVLIETLEQMSESGTVLSEDAVFGLQDLADERSISLLIRTVRRADPQSQPAAADALVALGSKAASQLLDAFEHDPDIRRSWGRLVARVAGPAALDPLLSAFASRYASVRKSATEGLQELAVAALPALLNRLPRADADQCADILGILGSGGFPEALDQILARTGDIEPFVRVAAIRALAKFDTPDAARALASAATSPNWQIRRAAMYALGDRPWWNHAAGRILGDGLQDANPEVAAAAAESLARVSHRFSLEDVESLVQVLHAGDEQARLSARETLRSLRGVIAFSIAAPRLSSPEGEIQRGRIERALRIDFDLTPYDAAARKHFSSDYQKLSVRASDPPALTDAVRFSVLSPLVVTPGNPCLVDVWVHSGDLDPVLRDRQREPGWQSGVGVRSKGPVDVTRGTTLVAKLMVSTLGWSDEDTVKWTGVAGNATYSFVVPADAAHGEHVGQLQVHVGGIQLARVSFLMTVGGVEAGVQDVTISHRVVSSAFASYATEDRNEVLARIQGMLKIARHLDIFLDVVSLRSGDRWEERLESEILERDVLYLFWSRAASASHWVDKEWRTAYRNKGLNGIDPVPLEPPDVSPPPPELASLHFSDWTLQVRRAPDS